MTPGDKIKRAREAKGWSQQDLATKIHITQPAIKKIESGETQHSKYLPQIAAALDLDLSEISPTYETPNALGIIPKQNLIAPGHDFPVHAAAEGGQGTLIISPDAIDFIPRPAPLVHVKESYGILVVGTSMEPEFRQGDTALVNPKLPPMTGEAHIFYSERDGQGRATIKELRRQSSSDWIVRQHNPPSGMAAEFKLPRGEWQWAHRVVGTYKRR